MHIVPVCPCVSGVPESSVGPAQLADDPVQLGVDSTAHALHQSLHASEALVDYLKREGRCVGREKVCGEGGKVCGEREVCGEALA